jgi:D-alanyl-D-alanine carboxypeptidase (penicillin-binding protein 5/6)
MKKIYLIIITLLLIVPINIFALEYPSINSKIVEVYDINDDKVLYEVDSNKQTSIASLTKIATVITAIENIKNLNEEVVITKEIMDTVSWDASKAGLKVGDKVTYKDLLYAAMLPSGADATNALAILISGSIDNYVIKMNELAKKIGLENTHFVNVTGLDINDHYSTANDVRKLLNYALKNKTFKEVYVTKEYTLANGLIVKSTVNDKYGKTIDVSKILGSKTGYTGNAGYCIATLSKTDGHDIIIVLLGANHINDKYYNIVDSIDLINFVNDNYSNKTLLNKNSEIKRISVSLSDISNYVIKSKSEIIRFLPNDFDVNKFKYEYNGINELSYKNKKGEKLGNIIYYYDDKILLTEDVILDKEIKISYKKIIKKYLVYEIAFFMFLIIVIIFIIYLLSKKKKANEMLLK